jgi:hypothetical protein
MMYRSIRQEESRDNQMSCIVNLLEFYNEHHREEMFVRHLRKLYDLHIECENWPEAGFTLEKQVILKFQCCGSMTFWGGSGSVSADPYL